MGLNPTMNIKLNLNPTGAKEGSFFKPKDCNLNHWGEKFKRTFSNKKYFHGRKGLFKAPFSGLLKLLFICLIKVKRETQT